MVWPDRRPKPAMWEHKRLAAPVRIGGAAADLARGRVEIANHQHFRDLGWLRAGYSLTVDGAEIAGGAFELPALGPGERANVELPGWVAPPERLGRGVPDRSGHDRRGVGLGAAGLRGLCRAGAGRRAGTARGRGPRRAADPDATVPLDDDGLLQHPAFAAPPTLALWRAPTDNDRIGGMAARWAQAGRRSPRAPARRHRADAARRPSSAASTRPAAGIEVPHEATYTPLPGGAISVVETVELPDALDDLPRVGTVLELRPGHETLRWFGSGPHETYPDRKRGGLIGTWDSTVTDQYVPYIRPQENGGHADVRWLEVTRAPNESAGIRIELDEPRQVSVTHLRAADLAAATHDIDVVPVAETIVHLDAAHRGLGTASCGPDTLPEYRLGPGTYRWAWTIRDLPRS